jgi:hypothetical protein
MNINFNWCFGSVNIGSEYRKENAGFHTNCFRAQDNVTAHISKVFEPSIILQVSSSLGGPGLSHGCRVPSQALTKIEM